MIEPPNCHGDQFQNNTILLSYIRTHTHTYIYIYTHKTEADKCQL